MPPVVGAIAAGALAASTGITILGVAYTGLTAGLIVGVGSFALSTLQSALTKTSKTSSGSDFQASTANQNVQILQALVTRKLNYGEVRRSGAVLFAASTENNTYLHLVIEVGWQEIEEIGEVLIDDTSVPPDYLDSGGNVVEGKYAGYVRIKKHLGAADQVVDPDLLAECGDIVETDRFIGIPYIYVRYKKNADVFPSGRPDISIWLRGMPVYDPRTETTRWTANIALQARDYLSADYGGGTDSAGEEIDDDETTASANVCDEIVRTEAVDAEIVEVDTTLNLIEIDGYDLLPFARGDRVKIVTNGTPPGGLDAGESYYVVPYQRKDTLRIGLASNLSDAESGTLVALSDSGIGSHTVRKTGEPRYWGGGILDTESEVSSNRSDIVSGMGGTVVQTGNVWRILAAAYRNPVVTLDENHLRAPITVRPLVSEKDLFNTVKGVYVSPLNGGTATDYPAYQSAAHLAADGRERITDLDLPFTQTPTRATRIAKLKEQRHRQELVCEYPMNLHGLRLRAGDTVKINNTRMGWVEKVFEVLKWELKESGSSDVGGVSVPLLGIKLQLQETAASIYDWSSTEEGAVDVAPNTNLPDPFSMTVLVGFSLDSLPVATKSGDVIYEVEASWDQPANAFVTTNGKIEIRWMLSGGSVWKYYPPVDGAATKANPFRAERDAVYDVQARAVNSLGVPSAWTGISGFIVGTSAITDTEDWENETLIARSGQDWETDSLTAEDWE